MCALLRKALLMKALPDAPREQIEKNYAVLKCEKNQTSASFEPPIGAVKNENSSCGLAVFDGENAHVFFPYSVARDKTVRRFALENGYAAAIFIFERSPRLLFYGSCLKEEFSAKRLEKIIVDKLGELAGAASATIAPTPENPLEQPYDDDALAETNYYEHAEKTENAVEGENYDALLNEISFVEPKIENFEKQAQSAPCPCENDATDGACPLGEELPAFYSENVDEIESIFDKYPPIAPLSDFIPESHWVKIEYKSGKYFLFGEIKKGGVPLYLVYGIHGSKADKPESFYSYSRFIPSNPYSDGDDGFWCAFQRTDDGEIER